MAETHHQICYIAGAEARFHLRVCLAKHYHLNQSLEINIALPPVVATLLKTFLCMTYQYQMTAANTASI